MDDAFIVAFEEFGHGGGEEGLIGFSDEVFGGALEELGVGAIGKDDDSLLVFHPEHDVREGLEESEGDLTGLEFLGEFGKAGIGCLHTE